MNKDKIVTMINSKNFKGEMGLFSKNFHAKITHKDGLAERQNFKSIIIVPMTDKIKDRETREKQINQIIKAAQRVYRIHNNATIDIDSCSTSIQHELKPKRQRPKYIAHRERWMKKY